MKVPREVGLVPIIVYIVLIWLGRYLDPSGELTFNPPFLPTLLNVIFVTGTSIIVAGLSAQSYLKYGNFNILLLGSAILAIGLASLIGGYSANFVSGNYGVTTHNIIMLLASSLLVFNSILYFTTINRTKTSGRAMMLMIAFSSIILFAIIITALTYSDSIPTFLGSAGPTEIRQMIVTLATVFLALSSLILYSQYLKSKSRVQFWTALGLGMFAIGMAGLLFQVVNGDLSSWIGRLAQYTGGLYFLIAVLSVRSSVEQEATLSERWSETFGSDRQEFANFFATMLNGFMYGRIVTDKNGWPVDIVLLDVNDAFERITGIQRDAIIGKRLTEQIPALRDDLRSWIAQYQPIAQGGQPVKYESYIEPLNKWINVSAYSPRKGYFVAIFEEITERKKAEGALKESEARYRGLFENMQEEFHFWKVVRDGEGRIKTWTLITVNPPTLRTWNKKLEDIVGKTTDEIFGPGSTEHYMPMVQKVMNEGVPYSYEDYFPNLNRFFHFTTIPFGEYFVTTGLDITDIKSSQIEAEKERSRLQSIMNGARKIHLVYLDCEFNFIRVNEAYAETCGYRPEEMIGKNHFDLYPDPEVEAIFQQVIDADEPVEIHDRPFVFPDQPERGVTYWDWSLEPIKDRSGKCEGLVFTLVETTERKKVEEDLRRSNAELQQFAYVASHDMQEPLRMVTSYLDLMNHKFGGELKPEAKEYMSYAIDGAERMRMLVNDLLAYSRVETKGRSFSTVNMEKVAEDVLKSLSTSVAESKVDIYIGPLPSVYADETQMFQLLQNLVSNAIKFRGTSKPIIKVDSKDGGNEWIFLVEDNGIGIDPIYKEKLFKMFQRLHTQEEYPGTGIGLAISKKIVERHGGRIWFESDGRNGTTFFFTIPKGTQPSSRIPETYEANDPT